MSVGTPTVDANGVKYYPVTSVYQGSQQQIIRVLEPTNPAPGKPPRHLYVLPVDAGVDTLSSTYSDGLEELRLLNVPNRFNMTLIAPSFNYEPWYGDNIIDPTKRMESFIIDDLVPFGDTFAHSVSVAQRYLIGFSKSGNGVLFLILRHPGVFNGAAAWDSPAQLSDLFRFLDLPENFGTQANFNLYNIPALVSRNAGPFQQQNRLWISGDPALYTSDMTSLHSQLTAASIPHTWVQGGSRDHSWNSGWLDGAVIDLNANATLTPPAAGTLPPVRSGGQPTGVLAPGTSQTTLSLMTDGNATCRYATTAGITYGSMVNTFSSTGSTAHSTLVTGLVNGRSYSHYVRCQDTAGNANPDDFVITFSVGQDSGSGSRALVQTAGSTSDAGSSFISQAFNLSNTAGNTIILAVSWGDQPAPSIRASDTLGNTYSVATNDFDPGNLQGLAILYATIIQSGANTVNVSLVEAEGAVVGYRRIIVSEYSGIATTTPLDATAKYRADGNTLTDGITSTAATTTVNGDLIFGAVMDDSGAFGTITAGTGFTQRASLNNMDMAIQDLVQTFAGPVSSTFTFSLPDRYLAQMATFKAAVTGGGPPQLKGMPRP